MERKPYTRYSREFKLEERSLDSASTKCKRAPEPWPQGSHPIG
jgi:hypothetical protein